MLKVVAVNFNACCQFKLTTAGLMPYVSYTLAAYTTPVNNIV